MSQKNNSKKKSERHLPDVKLLDEQQLYKVILTPEENFMPQEIRDYLRQGREEWERRSQVRKENKEKRKRGPRPKPNPRFLAKYKQGRMDFKAKVYN